jgi:hypothetical protein
LIQADDLSQPVERRLTVISVLCDAERVGAVSSEVL